MYRKLAKKIVEAVNEETNDYDAKDRVVELLIKNVNIKKHTDWYKYFMEAEVDEIIREQIKE